MAAALAMFTPGATVIILVFLLLLFLAKKLPGLLHWLMDDGNRDEP